MKAGLLKRRKPQVGGDGSATEAPPVMELVPIADASSVVSSRLGTAAVTGVLWVCLAAAPVGAALGGWSWWQHQHATTPAAVAVDQSNAEAIGGAFAQQLVLAWLSSTQQNPAPLMALMPSASVSQLARQAYTVSTPRVAGIVAAGGGVWSVTVSATVTDAARHTAVRYYQVPVQVQPGSGGTVTALSLPSVVSGPVVGASSTSQYTGMVNMTGPVAQTITQFLAAYLAGSGNVSRYTTPGVVLNPVSPAPFSSVQLTSLSSTSSVSDATPANGQRIQVQAVVSAMSTSTQMLPVSYALVLTARAGRWEITSISPAPSYQAPAASAGGAPATAGASTGTSVPSPSGESS